MTSRSQIRQQVREQRRALSPREREAAAWALADELGRQRLFRNARHLAAYLAVDGEMDPLPLMLRAWEMGKQVYLPVLIPVGGNRLWFAPYQPGDPLTPNRFGIPEPLRAARQRIPPQRLDLVLTPLVAFDEQGHRLGMGGGFYDRSFAYLRRHRHWLRPHLVGLAYDFQRRPALPAADWDVPLSAVATEQRLYLPQETVR
ncbi:5-formyltetrahydrofolate cyclo-ligase [Thiohalobacter sp. IOR34]|uniref:5-formyltetrahydrofolate cyclo-ligase n=1 Tax=Thiohalobacter sp. IOR34 TaxID=3057176 RepID=UPI0025B1B5C9|nr:5-formyltetrahydrofolate cyclo-ligase [Thiohalobacter sp. IOR34]WJW75872.1 5-formyltetrahydrofolate cyclo-ligase [Thiohalobacter sp. IOR34]